MPRILVVDDETPIREMLSETLRLEGYECVAAADGDQAIDALAEHAFDVVVTDIHMPGKEGLQLIKEVRKQHPSLKIVAISGGQPGLKPGCNLELASMFGADITCHKPLDIDAFLETLATLLKG